MERICDRDRVSGRHVMFTDAAGNIQTTDEGELIVADTTGANFRQ